MSDGMEKEVGRLMGIVRMHAFNALARAATQRESYLAYCRVNWRRYAAAIVPTEQSSDAFADALDRATRDLIAAIEAERDAVSAERAALSAESAAVGLIDPARSVLVSGLGGRSIPGLSMGDVAAEAETAPEDSSADDKDALSACLFDLGYDLPAEVVAPNAAMPEGVPAEPDSRQPLLAAEPSAVALAETEIAIEEDHPAYATPVLLMRLAAGDQPSKEAPAGDPEQPGLWQRDERAIAEIRPLARRIIGSKLLRAD